MNNHPNSGNGSLHQDSPHDLVSKLTAAIQAGDKQKAEMLAIQLSNLKLKLNISLEQEETEQRCKEKEFDVKVHIEDRVSKGCVIPLNVKACDTIEDLKKKMMLNFDFPYKVQHWIIGKKIPQDEVRLSQCGVKGPGHTLYLYLVTARSVGLKKEEHEMHKQALIQGIPLPGSGHPPNFQTQFSEMSDLISPVRSSPAPSASSGSALPPLFDLGSGMGADLMAQPGTNRQMSKRSMSSGSSRLQNMLDSPNLSLTSGAQSGTPLNGANQGEGNYPLSPTLVVGPRSPRSLSPAESNSISPARRSRSNSRSPPYTRPAQVGWVCRSCTFINLPARPGCEMCANPRPQDYQIPANYNFTPEELALIEAQKAAEEITTKAENERVFQNYQQLLDVEGLHLIPNPEPFCCPICFDDVEKGEGILLRECLHMFCKDCLQEAVRHSDEAFLKCPFQDNIYSCDAMLQEREIRALVTEDVYMKYLQRGLDQAESQATNSYHCKTSDCHGWCLYEDLVNFFVCPVCRKENCLTCKAIHEGMNCKEYQRDLEVRSANDAAAKQTKEMLERLVAAKEAMHCPQCNVVVQKKGGCDWIKCSICKLEICWVTQKPRWGPRGEGDISGGCGCRVNGKKCHPMCINCH